jgi:hypothetical protein
LAANKSKILIILQYALVTFVIGQHFITTQFGYSSLNSTQTLRLNGPINSLQFSDEADPLLIVSGRWRMNVNFDITGSIPVEIKGFNATLIVVLGDGSKTERYELTDFKQDSISYDNKTNISTIKGKLTMTSENPLENIGAVLRLINKNILTISLDPAKTKELLGETPIYGIER